MSGNMTRKGVLTKDINTAIIRIGLHGGLHCHYFAVFGRVPTDDAQSTVMSVISLH